MPLRRAFFAWLIAGKPFSFGMQRAPKLSRFGAFFLSVDYSAVVSAVVSAAGTSKVGAKPLSTIRSYTFWV